MDTLWHDVRFAARQLSKQRMYSLVTIVTLALGIGANSAIFSVVYGVLLQPLPYPAPARIVGVVANYGTSPSPLGVSWPEAQFLEQHNSAFQYLAASTSVGFNLMTGTEAARVYGLRVSSQYFDVLGVHPLLGRTPSAEEDQPGGANAVVLSYGVWQRSLGGDQAVVGKAVRLDGQPFIVVGVMPAGFESQPSAQLWTTLAQVATTIGGGQNLTLTGRLRAGMSLAQANATMRAVTVDYRKAFPDLVSSDYTLGVASLHSLVVQDVRTPVKILFGAIVFVLLIACANVASLLLGRAASRRRELSVRVALGASRGRMIRLLLTESLLLSLMGGLLGLIVAAWSLDLLLAALPGDLGGGAIGINRWTLLFTFGVALLTGLMFGLWPALQSTATDPQASLQEGAARTTGGRNQHRIRDGLVVAEVALSLMLLVGAGLMIRTVGNLLHVDPGFDAEHVAAAELWLTGTRYTSTTTDDQLYQRLVRRAGLVPGVTAAAVVEAGLPLQRGGNTPIWLDGTVLRSRGGTDFRSVTPDYFAALGVAVRQGRLFGPEDNGGGRQVMVVNEAFARQFLAGGTAIGRQMQVGAPDQLPRAVVGVVGDVRSFIGSAPQPTVFIPQAQTPIHMTQLFGSWYPIHLLVHTRGDPAAVVSQLTRIIHDIDPEIPVGRASTMAGVLSQSLGLRHFLMLLLGIFAGLAVVLALVGIYGLIAYVVAQGTRDIGVRLALGARGRDVVGGVMRRGLLLTLAGAAFGLIGALGLTRLLANQLYGISATDPRTLAAVSLLLVGVAMLACWLPARRAARVDPLVSLRSD